MGFFLSLAGLLIKNYHVKRRHWLASILEILLPVAFFIGFSVIKGLFSDATREDGWYQSSGGRMNTPYGIVQVNPQDNSINQRLQGNAQSATNVGGGDSFCKYLAALAKRLPSNNLDDNCVYFDDGITKIGLAAQDPADRPKVQEFVDFVTNNWCEIFAEYAEIYDSSDVLQTYLKSDDYARDAENPRIFAAVVFHSMESPGNAGDWDYSLRFNTTEFGDDANKCNAPFVPNTKDTAVSKLQKGVVLDEMRKYLQSGFVTLQTLIDRYIIMKNDPNVVSGTCSKSIATDDDLFRNCEKTFLPQYAVGVPMPARSYVDSTFYDSVLSFLAIMYVLAYMYALFKILASLVEEKELKIREGLAIMGIGDTTIYISWFITYAFTFMIIAIIVSIIGVRGLNARFSGIFSNSDYGVVGLFFFFFGTSIIAYSYLISAFFNKAKAAGIVGVVVYFGLFFISLANLSAGSKSALCILSPLAFSLGIETMAKFEGAGLGVTSSNMRETLDDLTFATPFFMLIFDTVLYSFLGWYLNKVVPREWGVVLPWYFPCMPSYWCGSRPLDDYPDTDETVEVDTSGIEPVGEDLQKLRKEDRCVHISNLGKVFNTPSGKKVAVNRLNLTLYEGQIFALLGHNGAGKSTTINILSGMLAPSSGTAHVLGYDLSKQMIEIRKNMGVCPQHDVLYPELTVKEHLEIFGKIKGLTGRRLVDEVRHKIEEVGLTEKADVLSKNLSGGMKRKLSVAIALIGDSKVIFLDEPTSGMDPYSRRFTWDVLKKNRAGRIMVLTTHFMDEADLLGDRIAIMADGQLRCCGTPLFLKNRYGQGYHLTLSKTETCDPARLKSTVSTSITGSKMISDVGTEMTFQLPLAESGKFSDLLASFDDYGAQLGVREYGISITTMEEIFLRVARGDADDEHARVKTLSQDKRLAAPVAKIGNQFSESTLPAQIAAIYKKRWLCGRRDFKGLLCSFLIPLLLVAVGLLIVKFGNDTSDDPSLTLSVRNVEKSTDFLYTVPIAAQDPDVDDLLSFIKDATVRQVNLDGSGVIDEFQFRFNDGLPCPIVMGSRPDEFDCSLSNAPLIQELVIRTLGNTLEPADDVLAMLIKLKEGWRGKAFYASTVPSYLNVSTHHLEYAFMWNTTAKHGFPTFYSAINSAAAKLFSSSSITVRSWPFPTTATVGAFVSSISSFNATIFIMIAIAFIPAGFVAYIVRERELVHNAKHLQMLSGCTIAGYWIGNFLWDLTAYLPFFGIVILLVYGFDVEPMVQDGGISVVILLFLLFGFAIVPFTYFLSFLFNSPSSAQNWLVLFNFITGLALTIVAMLLSLPGIASQDIIDINESMKYVYRLFPGFCVGDGLYSLAIANIVKGVLGLDSVDPWKWSISGANLMFLAIDAVVYTALAITIDLFRSYPRLQALVNPSPKIPEQVFLDIDEDVAAEESRVDRGDASGDAVLISGVRKIYSGGKIAVHKMKLGIPKGECFGLLGINGAGKTSLMKILTGDLAPTSGIASLAGFDVISELREVRKIVGYCPQFDALTDLLSVREHLEMYSRLRGIPADEIEEIVQDKMTQLDLRVFEHRLAHQLSGGNKRKLSVAIATIGNPPIVFLDEPSTGMDPMARRFMWQVIADISTRSKESTVILTTHSMEECEALCTNVGIMVGGRFRCLGNVQRLKSRFGKGCTITMKLKDSTTKTERSHDSINIPEGKDRTATIIDYFDKRFSGYEVVESTAEYMTIRLKEVKRVSQVFEKLEKNKKKLGISEYSVSQTTLEQIFNSFAALQEEEKAPAPGLQAVQTDIEMQDAGAISKK